MDPVNRLSQAMREVSDSADYSQRLPLWAMDEFGLLTESFNHLLAQLQANDIGALDTLKSGLGSQVGISANLDSVNASGSQVTGRITLTGSGT